MGGNAFRERGNIRMEKLEEHIKKKFNLNINKKELLKEAFTHSSYVNEHRLLHSQDNERLEFLGDAVLELAISHYLFSNYPEYPEGVLTRMRSSVVREISLSHFAQESQFDQYVLLGKGEEAMNGRKRASLLADLFEAFIGAVFLDQGMNIVEDFLAKIVFPKIDEGAFSYGMDYKTELQEYLQRDGEISIKYELVSEEGPAHEKEFTINVVAEGHVLGSGLGKSKKAAEQHAAHEALKQLNEQK